MTEPLTVKTELARAPRIFLVAAEPSGDALAGDLIDALRALRPDVDIAGVGGPEMAKRGAVSPFDISELSVFGLFDGLKIINLVHQRAQETADAAKAFGADAVVLIDSWGFMLRAAWKLREALPGVPLIKYVAPQVFAARRERAKVAADTFDHLLAIHPFDAPYFTEHGMDVSFVGNPALERDLSGDGAAFRARHGVSPEDPLLLVLFGSRMSELTRLFPRFADAARRLKAERPKLRLITPLAPSIADKAREMIKAEPAFDNLLIVDGEERRDAFHAADVALACSGTVTLELARLGVPTVAAYRLGWLAWAAARFFLMKSKYISLANIAADEMLIPEHVQTQCRGDVLADSVAALLDDPARRSDLSAKLRAVTDHMRGEGGSPSANAAAAVLSLI
ncbi:lipid-A-disaccharide synthase [Oceanicaulis sp.]|uniref:lipid-A-disaccharide synthase n=1 Tax=Oceanicaulis sp. TaxID=1924941 RepID=UPI003BAA92C2